MQIEVNSHNEIIAYDEYDELTPAIQIDPSILPADFGEKFMPSYYLYSNNAVVVNLNYVAQKPDGPSDVMQAINALGLQVALIQQQIRGGSK